MQGVCPSRAGNVPLPLDRSLPRTASYEDGVAVLKSAAFSSDIFYMNAELLVARYWVRTVTGSGSSVSKGSALQLAAPGVLRKVDLGGSCPRSLRLRSWEIERVAGVVQVDLIPFVRRMALRISAHVVGLDDLDAEHLTTLTGMLGQLADGILIQWSTRDRSEVMREALQTKQEFWDQFVWKALAGARSPRRGQTGEEGDRSSRTEPTSISSWSHDETSRKSWPYMAAVHPPCQRPWTHSIETWLALVQRTSRRQGTRR